MSRVLKLPSITTRKPQVATLINNNNKNEAVEYPFFDKIGQRVSIPSMNVTGTLRYVGQPEFKKGVWAGIELSDAQGKNDGSVQGVRYFSCPPDCGIFIGVGKIVLVTSTPTPPLPPPPSSTQLPLPPPPPPQQQQQQQQPTSSLLPPPAPIVKPSTSTRRSNLPLIPKPNASSSSSSSSNSKASKTMLKRPGSRTPSQSTIATSTKTPSKTPLTKKPSKTLTHKPSKTFTKRSHHLRVSSVPSESTPTPSSTTPPPPMAQANSTTINSTSNITTTNNITTNTTTSPTTNTIPKRESLKHSTPSPQLVKRDSIRSTHAATPPPPSPPYEEEVQQLKKQLDDCHDELDQMKREKQVLLTQMKGKETAWERLVSSKESLSLQVEEKHEQHTRTQRELDHLKLEHERLQADLADRDASLAKNMRDDEKQSQDQRRIERLEHLVRELQTQIQTEKEQFSQAEREHAGMLDQVRREVTAGESMTAALEKECADLRRAGLEAIGAYEQSVMQLNAQHESQLTDKDDHIRQLNHVITELKRKQSILFDDEEEADIDAMLAYHSESDQRHRLEEQLELTMAELDHERVVIKNMVNELEQLKAEAVQLRQQKSALEDRFMALQSEFEKELQDKKRLIEEADAAFEAQARAEDDHYQIKLEKMAIEKELGYFKQQGNDPQQKVAEENEDLMKKEKQDLINMNRQLEKDCMKLMDEMLVLEKQLEQQGDTKKHVNGVDETTTALRNKIEKLEKENDNHRHSLSQLELEKKTQVNQLSKDLAELESLVENKVFGEADLEEKLEKERRRVSELEKELKKLKTNSQQSNGVYKHTPLSPTTTTTATEDEEEQQPYCELCDETGHDIVQCKFVGESKYDDDTQRLYCENCDDYGLHMTDDCPNQDETF